jgi:DNA-binding response OmpR family regulator
MRRRILVVDDSELVLQWTRVVLGDEYDVITRNDPVGTGAAVIREQPDLVLLDIDMPLVRGDELVASLKRSAAGKGTVVALYSGLEPAELEAKMAACGADGYVTKTNDQHALRERIREILGGRGRGRRPVEPAHVASALGDLSAEVGLALVVGEKTLSAVEKAHLGKARIACTESIIEAYELLLHDPPRLVILGSDLAGPETLSFCRRVRKERATQNIPILWIDSGEWDTAAATAKSAGATLFLARPFRPEELVQAVFTLVRVAPRRRVRILVRTRKVGFDGPFRHGFSRDLSTSGMLLETEECVDVGDQVDVRFFVPGAQTEIVANAQVVRHHVPPSHRRVVGIHFTQLGRVCELGIAQFVERERVQQAH